MISAEDCVELAIRGLEVYVHGSEERLIQAAQNQSIRTNLVKSNIVKSQGDCLCRVCGKVDESIDHIVNG